MTDIYKQGWRRWGWIAWRVKCWYIKLSKWSIMLSPHYREAIERNVGVSVYDWGGWGLKCMSLESMLLTAGQPKLIFNKHLPLNDGGGLLLQREGLCALPQGPLNGWLAFLLACFHLSGNILLLLSVALCCSQRIRTIIFVIVNHAHPLHIATWRRVDRK